MPFPLSPVASFLEDSNPNIEYYIMLVGASLIALIGILLDSQPLVIASMLVAPLLQPILLFAYGICYRKIDLVIAGARTFVLSILIVFLVSVVGLFFLDSIAVSTDSRMFISFNPTVEAAIIISIICGIFATLGIYSKRIESVISGIGIAVSLMPPLVATAIGLVLSWSELFWNALTIFGVNVFGVLLGRLITFW